jgi:hypothetical protein
VDYYVPLATALGQLKEKSSFAGIYYNYPQFYPQPVDKIIALTAP